MRASLHKWVALSVFVSTLILAALIWGVVNNFPERWAMYRSRAADVGPITFYGKVIDKDGSPIEGAEITVVVESANRGFLFGDSAPISEQMIDLRTDPQGRFEIRDQRGFQVLIREIEKKGYRFKPRRSGHGDNEMGFDFNRKGLKPEMLYHPDREKPSLFILQRDNQTGAPP